MSIKPPPVPFEAGVDHERTLTTIEHFAKLLRTGPRTKGNLLRQLHKLTLIERTLKSLLGDGEAPRAMINGDNDNTLFPSYRTFYDQRENREIRLLVQDLCAVWNGKEFEGDGSCTLNKACQTQSFLWPKRAWIFHVSRDPWGLVVERTATGKTFIPPIQNFRFELQPDDYVVGELYVEIC